MSIRGVEGSKSSENCPEGWAKQKLQERARRAMNPRGFLISLVINRLGCTMPQEWLTRNCASSLRRLLGNRECILRATGARVVPGSQHCGLATASHCPVRVGPARAPLHCQLCSVNSHIQLAAL